MLVPQWWSVGTLVVSFTRTRIATCFIVVVENILTFFYFYRAVNMVKHKNNLR